MRAALSAITLHPSRPPATAGGTDLIPVIREVGGAINGSTNQDRTNYWELVPSNFLETALFMEAVRMKGLLEAMTQTKLDNQRDVVKNEKRQRIDNQPYGQTLYKIAETMFPEGHPYHWSVIGSMEDLSAASMDDVKAFFRRYYVPNNASLVISGDFDPKEARARREVLRPDPEGRARDAAASPAAETRPRDTRADRRPRPVPAPLHGLALRPAVHEGRGGARPCDRSKR